MNIQALLFFFCICINVSIHTNFQRKIDNRASLYDPPSASLTSDKTEVIVAVGFPACKKSRRCITYFWSPLSTTRFWSCSFFPFSTAGKSTFFHTHVIPKGYAYVNRVSGFSMDRAKFKKKHPNFLGITDVCNCVKDFIILIMMMKIIIILLIIVSWLTVTDLLCFVFVSGHARLMAELCIGMWARSERGPQRRRGQHQPRPGVSQTVKHNCISTCCEDALLLLCFSMHIYSGSTLTLCKQASADRHA